MCIDTYFEQMIKGLAALVRQTAQVSDGQRPLPRHRSRARRIIMVCCGGFDIDADPAGLCARPQHVCNGCCPDPGAAVNQRLLAIYSARRGRRFLRSTGGASTSHRTAGGCWESWRTACSRGASEPLPRTVGLQTVPACQKMWRGICSGRPREMMLT